ncbi:MAG: DUF6464 family protein [Elainellaceae cyanobacterium]
MILGLLPALVSWWLIQWTDAAAASPRWLQRQPPAPDRLQRLARLPAQPERRYIQGLGPVIGNISCRFNARSGYLRCAVNPMGPCQGCLSYESVVIED